MNQWFQRIKIKTKHCNDRILNYISRLKREQLVWWENQLDVFDRVYKYNNWKCILTWQKVDKNNVSCYPHYLWKWWYPHLKLKENNIWLVYNESYHNIIDKIIRILRKEIWYKEIERRIQEWLRIEDDILRIYNQKFK